MIITPPAAVLSSALEAVASDIPLVVIITEFVPVLDSLRYVKAAKERGVTVAGPNTIGVIRPARAKSGSCPTTSINRQNRRRFQKRHADTRNFVQSQLCRFGQSTCLCIGGDPIRGRSHTEGLALLRDDPDTLAVILIGEIGGSSEEDAARYVTETNYPKPVIAYIAGAQAPEGKKMGHAGAIVSGGLERPIRKSNGSGRPAWRSAPPWAGSWTASAT